ncbi:MAG: signal peptidase II [Bryobacteraceae bacterium]|nr:signal peptidase II [Bryobacteraceae bacterium]
MNRLRQQALLAICAIVAADRASKLWIEGRLGLYDTLPVIPGIFNLVHTENPGAAFSLLADASPAVRFLVLICASLVMMGVIGQMLWAATASVGAATKRQRTALILILGGALGNLYDRIFFGRVTDFLQVFLGSYEWPSFNIADSCICVGAVLLALDMLTARSQSPVRTA